MQMKHTKSNWGLKTKHVTKLPIWFIQVFNYDVSHKALYYFTMKLNGALIHSNTNIEIC